MAEGNYTEKIGFMSRESLKTALEEFAKKEGVKPAVINRKALVEYLEKHGALKKNKQYL